VSDRPNLDTLPTTERECLSELAKIVGELARDMMVLLPAESNYYNMLAYRAAVIEGFCAVTAADTEGAPCVTS